MIHSSLDKASAIEADPSGRGVMLAVVERDLPAHERINGLVQGLLEREMQDDRSLAVFLRHALKPSQLIPGEHAQAHVWAGLGAGLPC